MVIRMVSVVGSLSVAGLTMAVAAAPSHPAAQSAASAPARFTDRPLILSQADCSTAKLRDSIPVSYTHLTLPTN